MLRLVVFIEVLIGADVADAPLRKAERFRLPQRDTQCGAAVLIQRAAETPGIDALSDPLEDAIFDVAENRVAVHGKQRLKPFVQAEIERLDTAKSILQRVLGVEMRAGNPTLRNRICRRVRAPAAEQLRQQMGVTVTLPRRSCRPASGAAPRTATAPQASSESLISDIRHLSYEISLMARSKFALSPEVNMSAILAATFSSIRLARASRAHWRRDGIAW